MVAPPLLHRYRNDLSAAFWTVLVLFSQQPALDCLPDICQGLLAITSLRNTPRQCRHLGDEPIVLAWTYNDIKSHTIIMDGAFALPNKGKT